MSVTSRPERIVNDGGGAQRDDVEYYALDQKAPLVWQLENAFGGAVCLALALVAFHSPLRRAAWSSWEIPVLTAIVALFLVDALLLIPRRHQYYRYALVGDSIVILRGKLFFSRSVFPLSKILYIQARQGPLLRRFGLVTIRIGTIAEAHSLGPLCEAEAGDLQRVVETRDRVE